MRAWLVLPAFGRTRSWAPAPPPRIVPATRSRARTTRTTAEWKPRTAPIPARPNGKASSIWSAQGPTVWGTQGPTVADIGQGCGKPEALHDVPAKFACELLKAIAMAESGWTQFCVPDTPADQVGGASANHHLLRLRLRRRPGHQRDARRRKPELRSAARGRRAHLQPGHRRQHPGQQVARHQMRRATTSRPSSRTGTRRCGRTTAWRTPTTRATRSTARAGESTIPRSAARPRTKRKYSAGWSTPAGSDWVSVPLAYPDPAEVGGSGAPPNLNEPHCASPTDCAGNRSGAHVQLFRWHHAAGRRSRRQRLPPTRGSGGLPAGGSGGAPSDGRPAGRAAAGGGAGQQTRVVGDDDRGCGCRSRPSARAKAPWFRL